MKRLAASFARQASLLVAASTAAGPTLSEAASDPMREPLVCSIKELARGAMVTVSGRVVGRAPFEGEYRLRVRKAGSAGTSEIAQGGAFHVEPSTEANLGGVSISLEQGARYQAILTLTVDGQIFTCEASGPGPQPL